MNGTLLIVEDQTFFRKGLRKMIEDHPIGWTVAGEAENGREALEFIERRPPDLVLTDIRMPGMDGIELAKHIHRNRLDIDLIILTGYEDFSYAQAALRYGAIDFLLKPCDEETLIGVLRKAYDHYRGKHQQKLRMQSAERAKEEALLRAFMLRLPHEAAEMGRLAERLRNRQMLFVNVASFYPDGKQYQERDLGLLQFALFNIITELMDLSGLRFQSVPLEFDQFALLVEGVCPENLASSVEHHVLTYLGIVVSVASSGPILKPEDLQEAYDRLGRSVTPVTRRTGHQAGGELSALIGQESQTKVKELQVQLSADIALGRVDNLRRSLAAAADRLAVLALEDAKLEAATLAFAMNASARQAFDLREEDTETLLGGMIERLQSARTPGEAAEWAKAAVEAFLAEYEGWKAGKNQNIVTKLLEYLDKHYMESCSLTETAARFHISTAYLSKLFKKETGDNFSAYVTKIRMQKAAMLLLNTDMKVFEIAQSVGYDDPNYFTNVFRLLHKLSPSDYRKQKKV